MLYAIVSDIHANAAALRRVMEIAAHRGARAMVCLGDIVGYGAQPNECCELLEQHNVPCIIGNHDRAACGAFEPVYFPAEARHRMLWTRSVLTTRSKRFLMNLPETRAAGGFVMAHGSLRHNSEYLVNDASLARSFQLQRELHPGTAICFYGHTHRQAIYESRAGELIHHEARQLHLQAGSLYHINPGSIGYPRFAGTPLCFALYDAAASTVEFVPLTRDQHPDLYSTAGPGVRWNTAILREYVKFASRSGGNYVRNRLRPTATIPERG